MKKIFIHAGLHKTGTTALQFALNSNRNALQQQGFYYPSSGIPAKYHGHHNFAWQLARDRRFRPEYGDIRALLKEIEGVKEDNIILSSEDFESSLLHPHRMQKISNNFLQNNAKVCIVIYIRSQVDYLQSLYFELLKWGLGDEFYAFARRVASTHKIEYKDWQFLFNYAEIAKTLQPLKGLEIVFRDYEDLVDNNTVSDFCKVIGVDSGKMEVPAEINKINDRLTSNTLLKLFIRNRVGALPEGALDVVDELFAEEDGKLVLSNSAQKIFQDLNDLNGMNKNMRALKLPENTMSGFNIEKVFSFETCGLVLKLMKIAKDPVMRKQLIAEWQGWVRQV